MSDWRATFAHCSCSAPTPGAALGVCRRVPAECAPRGRIRSDPERRFRHCAAATYLCSLTSGRALREATPPATEIRRRLSVVYSLPAALPSARLSRRLAFCGSLCGQASGLSGGKHNPAAGGYSLWSGRPRRCSTNNMGWKGGGFCSRSDSAADRPTRAISRRGECQLLLLASITWRHSCERNAPAVLLACARWRRSPPRAATLRNGLRDSAAYTVRCGLQFRSSRPRCRSTRRPRTSASRPTTASRCPSSRGAEKKRAHLTRDAHFEVCVILWTWWEPVSSIFCGTVPR